MKKNAIRERAKKELSRLSEAMASEALNTEQWERAYAMAWALEWIIDPRSRSAPTEMVGRRNVPEPDPEILAMRRAHEAVSRLSEAEQNRVVSWLRLRLADRFYKGIIEGI